jgi:hypothetical protein
LVIRLVIMVTGLDSLFHVFAVKMGIPRIHLVRRMPHHILSDEISGALQMRGLIKPDRSVTSIDDIKDALLSINCRLEFLYRRSELCTKTKLAFGSGELPHIWEFPKPPWNVGRQWLFKDRLFKIADINNIRNQNCFAKIP